MKPNLLRVARELAQGSYPYEILESLLVLLKARTL